MLKPPYSQYSRIYTYHISGTSLPVFDDPDFIGSWIEDGKTVAVFHKPKGSVVKKVCEQYGCSLFYQADIDYNDWEMGREVVPFTVGPLAVAPIWSSDQADIRIDPSVVFGNGFHPTTRLCLEMLVRFAPILSPGFTGLDLGCGTGLLALGAASLGASSVLAVDHNSLACQVAERNALYNRVDNTIEIKKIDLIKKLPDTGVDVLMANLHHSLLADLFSNPSFWRAGIYILSGFMGHEEELLLAALPEKTPSLLERGSRDKWRVWVMGENVGLV